MSDPQSSLTWVELSVAALLLLINVGLSWCLKLALDRQILISAGRMVVQLVLLGLVLKQIFSLSTALPVLALATTMTIIAGLSVAGRIGKAYVGMRTNAVISVWASSWLVTAVAVLMVVKPTPWHAPEVLIPLLGMVLGNSLTGISLAIDRFLAEVSNRSPEIELRFALGATRWQATQDCFSDAAKSAMIPILNTMSVAGMVSLPGMMTGQLLAGAAPIEAVRYQIMVMFVIAAAIALGVLIALGLTFLRITTSDHRLDLSSVSQKA